MWTLAQTIEREQEIAVGRLNSKASEATQNNTRQRVLDLYLGIDSSQVEGRFKAPEAVKRRG